MSMSSSASPTDWLSTFQRLAVRSEAHPRPSIQLCCHVLWIEYFQQVQPRRVIIFPDVFRAPTLSFFLARTCLKSNEVKNNSLKKPLTLIKGPDVLRATTLLTSFKWPYVYSRDRTSFYWQGCIFVDSSSIYRPLRLFIVTYVFSKTRTYFKGSKSIQRIEISSLIKFSIFTEDNL